MATQWSFLPAILSWNDLLLIKILEYKIQSTSHQIINRLSIMQEGCSSNPTEPSFNPFPLKCRSRFFCSFFRY